MDNSIKIIFDKSDLNPVFHPTDTVSGTVEITIDKSSRTKGLQLTVKGKTKVIFVDRNQNPFVGIEELMNYTTDLIDGREEITAGIHTFRFKCDIPEDVPASIAVEDRPGGLKSSIEYKVKARLNLPLHDIHAEREFTVYREEDLNLIPALDQAFHFQDTLPLENLCCKSEAVQLQIKVPKLGYVSKEKIPFSIYVAGIQGKFPVKKIQVKLVLERVCLSRIPKEKLHTERKELVNFLLPFVVESDFLHISNSIEVPDLCPISNNIYGRIYHIQYLLEFVLLSDGLEKTAIVSTPIRIGTIPIH